MKICANLSLMFQEVPLLERFQAAKNSGFNAVEIQFPYKVPLPELIEAKTAADVEVVLINVPAGDLMTGGKGLACVPDKVDEFEAVLVECLEYAEGLDVSCVNVLAGRCADISNGDENENYLETFEKNLVKAADALNAIGVLTTFEAINTTDMSNFLIHTAEQMWQIIEKLNHPNIKAQYDLYHMAMMGENLFDNLSNKMGQIGHIQFADMPGRGEPGTGDIPFEPLFDLINSSTYSSFVGAEYKPSKETTQTLDWMNKI